MSLSAPSVATPARNGPRIAPDASWTRQGPAVAHFHVYLLWHPLWTASRRSVVATATGFDEICDAYHRRLARYETAGPESVRIFRLRTELEGALLVYPDITHLIWLDRCDQPIPGMCVQRAEGWYDNWPHEPVRPLGDPA